MIIQSLHIISLVLTPVGRWKYASSPFKSIYSIDVFSMLILILSVIVICWLCAKYRRSELHLIGKIEELIDKNENLQQQNAELTAANEKLRQGNPELISNVEIVSTD